MHIVDGCYTGPAMEHYRCFKFWIPKTKKYRIAQTAKFFPFLGKMPTVDPNDATRLAACDLIKTLQYTNKNGKINIALTHWHALEVLADIFKKATAPQRVKNDKIPPSEDYSTPQRVQAANKQAVYVNTTTSHYINKQKKSSKSDTQ